MSLQIDEITGQISDKLTDDQKRNSAIIHMLHHIQKEHNYLPAEELQSLSEKLNIPLSTVYSTASFYKQFYFTPRGKNIVCVCVGTACHVRGAQAVVEQFKKTFDLNPGETAKDLSVTLETVGCIGCCGLAPAVVVNDEITGNLNPTKVNNIIEAIGSASNAKTE